MTGFKIKMARQHGEKIAEEYGFTAFPISPKEIAIKEEIIVQAKPPEQVGVSGALIFANNEVILIYSKQYNNVGFENFSIAHELGHYFLEGHPDEIINKQGGTHISRSNFTEGSSIELEADHFASGLLMPSHLVRQFLSERTVGLGSIIALAEIAGCSITAAAIRAAECSDHPMAIVMSKGDEIAYSFMTDNFKNLGKLAFLRKGSIVPISETRTFNQNPNNVLNGKKINAETTLADWFDGSGLVMLDEEIIGLGKYGYTLTVLSGEDLPVDPSDDYDDEDFEDQWTPKFAYGR